MRARHTDTDDSSGRSKGPGQVFARAYMDIYTCVYMHMYIYMYMCMYV